MAAIRGANGSDGANGSSGGAPNGTAGGNGGVGATSIDNSANIYGGSGGTGGSGFGSITYPGNGAPGGSGGTGVVLSTFFQIVDSTVKIYGGDGGDGGSGGHILFTDSLAPGFGGNGGVGVIVNTEVLLENYGGIYGGNGGAPGFGLGGAQAGVPPVDGAGGNAVDLSGGALDNRGTITGGNSSGVLLADRGLVVPGGAGVYLDGGTLANFGTISGGYGSDGARGTAVAFGPTAATLFVETGAIFNGQVTANSTNDTLQFSSSQDGAPAMTLGTQFTGFSDLNFSVLANWTVDLAAGAAPSGGLAVAGFSSADTLDLTNLTPGHVAAYFEGAVSVALPGNSYAIAGGSDEILTTPTDGTLTFTGNYTGEHFVLSPDGGGGTDLTLANGAPCFLHGTRIRTDRGECPVEQLQIGDRIATLSGQERALRWIGRRLLNAAALALCPDSRPVLIRAGALGEYLPRRNLWVSPEHALYINGALIPATLLTNGVSVLSDSAITQACYYHLEFDAHEVVFAEGAAAESFVDDDSRDMFDNAAEYHRLYPDAPSRRATFCAPRLEEGAALEHIRRQLGATMGLLSGITAEPTRPEPLPHRC